MSDLDEPSDNEETNGFEMTVDAENNLSNKAAWTIDGVEANTNAQ